MNNQLKFQHLYFYWTNA